MQRFSYLYGPFAALLFVIVSSYALAAPGMFDLSFGTNGVVEADLGGSDRFHTVVTDSQGRIVALGETYNTTTFVTSMVVARYLPDGTPDTTFDGDGVRVLDEFTGVGYDVAIHLDDRILIAAEIDSTMTVLRLKTDGSMDESFNTGGVSYQPMGLDSGAAHKLAVVAEDRIVVVGKGTYNENDYTVLLGLAAEGTSDHLIVPGGQYIIPAIDVANVMMQPGDGKIIIAGSQQTDIGVGQFVLLRTWMDGRPDNDFGDGGVVYTDVNPQTADRLTDAVLDANGKIVVTGYTIPGTIGPDGMVVARYNTDGTLDNTFDDDGIALTSFSQDGSGFASGLAIDGDGKIIVAGSDAAFFYSGQLALVRYNADGSLDTTFDVDGTLVTSGVALGEEGQDIVIDSAGRYVVAGFGNNNGVLYRFESDGEPVVQTVNNSGFENKAPTGSLPAGWIGKNLLNDKRLCNTDTKFITENGQCAFRFIGSLKNDSSLTRNLNISGLVAGDDLVLRFVASGEGVLKGKGEVKVLVTYKNKTTAAFKKVLPVGNYRDIYQSLPLNILRPVAKVTVTLRYFGSSGKVTFDDVSVLRLPAYTPPAAAALIALPSAP